MHYEQPVLMNFVITMCAVLTLVCCVYALIAIRQKRLGDPSRKSTWYIFLAGTMVIMFILGIILGTVNYWRHLESFYDIQNLSVYPAVDPDKSSGLQYMDAGRVMFVKDSKVQTSMSSGFKVSDTYCVAPIVSDTTKLTSFDFWAIGINCCSATEADFKCETALDINAHGGVRLHNNEVQKYFRLAVQQAEVKFGIRANHPLFFHFVEDPIADLNVERDAGFNFFLFWALFLFFVHVIFATIALGLFVNYSDTLS